MSTLFDKSDPLLADLRPEWLAALDVDQAGRRVSPWLIVAEWLRHGWNKNFPGLPVRVINDERLQAVCRRLDDEISPLDLGWAISAYGDECRSEPWRIERPSARLAFEAFLGSPRLEFYLQAGQALRDKRRSVTQRAAERRQEQRDSTSVAGLLGVFDRLPPAERDALVRRAVADLEARGQFAGGRTVGNPLVRAKVLQLLQRDLLAAGRVPPAISRSVESAMS